MSRYYCTVYLGTIYIYMSLLGTTGTLSSRKKWSDDLIISSIVVSPWRDPRRGKRVRKQPPKWKSWYVRPAVAYHSSTVLILPSCTPLMTTDWSLLCCFSEEVLTETETTDAFESPTSPEEEEQNLGLIIIPAVVVLVIVIIGMIVCGIFISRRWNSKARDQGLFVHNKRKRLKGSKPDISSPVHTDVTLMSHYKRPNLWLIP